ncbi:hypothetical protein ILUMI_07454 [Ignelater luminosus]|uniref:Uncharacterized protein n=1 Tax=Ignelater luminosus TaxID=2038154 RepID=A0A8K0DDH2_IGNLU|nr:hypothetical protein ILUMI_07454 [Ignelater luminosus]
MAGKEVELVEEVEKMAGVQPNGCGRARVAFLVKRVLSRKEQQWKFINERIMVLVFKITDNSVLTLIASYASKEDALTDAKQQFYKNLQKVIKTAPGEVIIMCDMNSTVGNCMRGFHQVIGGYGEDTRNDNGKRKKTARFLIPYLFIEIFTNIPGRNQL